MALGQYGEAEEHGLVVQDPGLMIVVLGILAITLRWEGLVPQAVVEAEGAAEVVDGETEVRVVRP